ncbi:hypothetical protein C8R47DRAFT_436606 [Mycena vitilis]|nr:hypothetical protein C8R47DRAFT_436606 [Mycena vitilis]
MAHLPPIRCAQGVNSKTFTPPEQSLTLPEICDWHYKHSKEHPLFVFVDESTEEVTTLPWGTAVEGIYRISRYAIQNVEALKNPTTRPTVGLCSTSDPFTYLLSMLGIMRAGYPVFLISSAASPVVLSHLISTSGVSLILTNNDDSELNSKLTAAVTEIGASNPNIQPVVASQLPWSQILPNSTAASLADNIASKFEDIAYDLDSGCVITHSSGSTAMPRLNEFSHKMVATAAWHPWYGELDICGEIMSVASAPLGGLTAMLLAFSPVLSQYSALNISQASSGLILSGLKPQSPPAPKTPANVWKAIVGTKSTHAFLRHPFIYTFSEDPDKRKILAQMKGVIFAGAPLKKAVGDQLALDGVNVLTLFASSEAGLLSLASYRDKPGEDWEYFSLSPLLDPVFIPQATGDMVELVLKTSPFHRPTQTNLVFDGTPAFATKDLLLRHPTKPGFWKFVCRVDDQEILWMGMSINACAFEAILAADPLIRGAVIFSHGPKYGVIIDPIPVTGHIDATGTPREKDRLKTHIWPTVERFNQLVPEPARLNKEIILFTTPDKPFVYGEKALPQRKKAMHAYLPEIEAIVCGWRVL